MEKEIYAYKMVNEFLNIFPCADKKELTEILKYLCEAAEGKEIERLTLYSDNLRNQHYGARVFFRGLIEFSNYCKNDCYYCGIRRGNNRAIRYRLTDEEILGSCTTGYEMGFRTFVLQSGDDANFTDEQLCALVYKIKSRFPNCAVTLSIGERSYASYKNLYDAGADRYLLRHETANEQHYKKLHPPELLISNRKECLYNLKKIGYQVGAGFMVGSPFQTYETLAEDLIFLRELQPHMIGIGPFIPHKETKFANYNKPEVNKTIILIALTRIMVPKALIPVTTALSTVDVSARERAFVAGANVMMPNLTPARYRDSYNLYDNKLCTSWEAAENLTSLMESVKLINMLPDLSRGDHVDMK